MTTEEKKLLNNCYQELCEIKNLLRTLCNNSTELKNLTSSILIIKQERLEVEIYNFLMLLGIPSHISGYNYIQTAIIIALKDYNTIPYVTKILYPEIAKIHKVTPDCVERAIRYAILILWKSKGPEYLSKTFECLICTKPSNAQFLALIINKIKLTL